MASAHMEIVWENEHFIIFEEDGLLGLHNKQDAVPPAAVYGDIRPWGGNSFLLGRGGKYGYVAYDVAENAIISQLPLIYDEITPYGNGLSLKQRVSDTQMHLSWYDTLRCRLYPGRVLVYADVRYQLFDDLGKRIRFLQDCRTGRRIDFPTDRDLSVFQVLHVTGDTEILVCFEENVDPLEPDRWHHLLLVITPSTHYFTQNYDTINELYALIPAILAGEDKSAPY